MSTPTTPPQQSNPSPQHSARSAPPRYYWKQCYEEDGRVHWALCDTQTDADAPPHRVSCPEMILWDHHSQDLPKKLMPKLIVELLNAHYAKAHNAPDQRPAANTL